MQNYFNFAVLFGSPNSQNKGHTNIKGFTVTSHIHSYNQEVIYFLAMAEKVKFLYMKNGLAMSKVSVQRS